MAWRRGCRRVTDADKMATALQSLIKRAAICVALFVVALTGIPSIFPANTSLQFVAPAHAKMRQAKLSIVPAMGGAVHHFDIEIASSEKEKELGLMFRMSVGETE